MKKRIAVLGSTGSIGNTLLKIISRNQNNFKIEILSAKKNYKQLFKQAEKFKVQNLIITDKKFYKIALRKKKKKINLYNNFNCFEKILPQKIDYVMNSIVGLDGLDPTIKIIKKTKTIAIANKESIICGWYLIQKQLKKYKTRFIPVDSEHFSIWYALNDINKKKIDKIYLTASGGSLLNVPKSKFNNLKISKILKHPNWNMGEKITIDSSTLMNKVFEIIEAKKIFNLKYQQLGIIIHPQSYVHAIVKFSDGMIKVIAHDTTMEIPIFNSLYQNQSQNIKTNKINFNILNKTTFLKVDKRKFPSVNIINMMPEKGSLYETVLVAANDEYVKLFLNKKIKFNDIFYNTLKIINKNEFKRLKKILPTNISDVINVSKLVKNKINLMNKYK